MSNSLVFCLPKAVVGKTAFRTLRTDGSVGTVPVGLWLSGCAGQIYGMY